MPLAPRISSFINMRGVIPPPPLWDNDTELRNNWKQSRPQPRSQLREVIELTFYISTYCGQFTAHNIQ